VYTLKQVDRDTGTNVLCDGDQTRGLVPVAPRVIQFAITNRCNLACTFCSRDTGVESAWTTASAFAMLAGLAEAGVLEVAGAARRARHDGLACKDREGLVTPFSTAGVLRA
jgi:hypothetical protein